LPTEVIDASGLTITQWVMLLIGAMGIGVSKSGFPGVSMLHVVLYAFVFGPKASTGILLPLLIVGDLCAIQLFGSKANWSQIRRLLPPTLIGIVIGFGLMGRLNDDWFRIITGVIILGLSAVQGLRMVRPSTLDNVPHHPGFAITLGLLAGITTMMANAAGPVIALYLLAVALPKWELIGTSAWLFLVLNVIKIPFSYQLDLIYWQSLTIGVCVVIMIPMGILAGRWLVRRVSQKWFNGILLGMTVVMAIRLLVG
jgi:uncharacterized protein